MVSNIILRLTSFAQTEIQEDDKKLVGQQRESYVSELGGRYRGASVPQGRLKSQKGGGNGKGYAAMCMDTTGLPGPGNDEKESGFLKEKTNKIIR